MRGQITYIFPSTAHTSRPSRASFHDRAAVDVNAPGPCVCCTCSRVVEGHVTIATSSIFEFSRTASTCRPSRVSEFPNHRSRGTLVVLSRALPLLRVKFRFTLADSLARAGRSFARARRPPAPKTRVFNLGVSRRVESRVDVSRTFFRPLPHPLVRLILIGKSSPGRAWLQIDFGNERRALRESRAEEDSRALDYGNFINSGSPYRSTYG